MAAARSPNPPSMNRAARAMDSAMVEQAPYSPMKGTPSSRRP